MMVRPSFEKEMNSKTPLIRQKLQEEFYIQQQSMDESQIINKSMMTSLAGVKLDFERIKP